MKKGLFLNFETPDSEHNSNTIVKLRYVEFSVFDHIVLDLRYLLSRAQGDTALYPQEPPVLVDFYR
jgi:hypothetical protein